MKMKSFGVYNKKGVKRGKDTPYAKMTSMLRKLNNQLEKEKQSNKAYYVDKHKDKDEYDVE